MAELSLREELRSVKDTIAQLNKQMQLFNEFMHKSEQLPVVRIDDRRYHPGDMLITMNNGERVTLDKRLAVDRFNTQTHSLWNSRWKWGLGLLGALVAIATIGGFFLTVAHVISTGKF